MTIEDDIETAVTQADEAQASQEVENQLTKADGEASSEQKTETEVPANVEGKEPAKEPERRVKRLEPWIEAKISQAEFQRREEARARKEAEDRAEALRREVEELRAKTQSQETVQHTAPSQSFKSDEEFQRAVEAEAKRVAETRAFNEACNRTFEKGKESYPDFEDAIKNLGTAGVLDQTNLDLVLAMDSPERVLYELGADPEKATRIFMMSPAKKAIELAKISVAPAKETPIRQVSRAPAPLKPVEGTARVSGEPRDDDDDSSYFAKRVAQRKARYGR